ncbi:hypothetical protein EUX98_g4425 [Antrodiella citrinella]|uniref:Uncharacterized protein n=1 Tax=Antrodiella citrinella TaxID=2447956 RepID=A0A4S4MTY8_9APHY|nr:hypothetical protein EUX98_g4425 [Antrodiella citrinella]
MASFYPNKRRRTATGVLAGDCGPRPQRDVLTSLLNGVPKYVEVENDEARRVKKKEKRQREKDKERERERKRANSSAKPLKEQGSPAPVAIASTSADAISAPPPVVHKRPPIAQPRPIAASAFWQARPSIHIPMNRAESITPPPMPSSPSSTPDPSMSSATSATSSKRPYTPDDGESVTDRGRSGSSPPPRRHVDKKRRVPCKKGWKGWVEGSPEPSEKLINLDAVTVLHERKTRSGKNFDAIGLGKEGWV